MKELPEHNDERKNQIQKCRFHPFYLYEVQKKRPKLATSIGCVLSVGILGASKGSTNILHLDLCGG